MFYSNFYTEPEPALIVWQNHLPKNCGQKFSAASQSTHP